MFKDLSYKKKFYFLLILCGLLSFAAYKRSFKGTLESVRLYNTSKEEIARNIGSQEQIGALTRDIQRLDNIIGKKAENPEIIQNKILSFLSDNGREAITLSKINNTHISVDDYFEIYSHTITLKGAFNDLLSTIYSFEQDFQHSRIASLRFYISRDPRTKKKQLYNDIIFQNYEKRN